MPTHPSLSLRSPAKARSTLSRGAIVRRFARTDGRFDLPVVAGRTAKQVTRRLA